MSDIPLRDRFGHRLVLTEFCLKLLFLSITLYNLNREQARLRSEPIIGQIGPLVRSLRAVRAITQEELASRAGLSRATVSNVERDSGVPGFDVVIKLARALGVSPAAFLPPEPVGQQPASWETVARRLRLTYEEAMSLKATLGQRGIAESATTEEALLVWMREQKVLP